MLRAERRAQYLEQLRELVEGRGGRLLSTSYVDTRTKVRIECSVGHRWAETPEHVAEGRWCSRCSAQARRQRALEALEDVVRARGGKILSKYRNANTHVRFACVHGHTWRTQPIVVLRRRAWCPTCADAARIAQQRADALARLQQIVDEHGGRILSPWVGSRAPLLFECARGHTCWRQPAAIRAGEWCSVCRGTRLCIEQAHDVARERGGRCLSAAYRGGTRPLRWRCAAGHEWSTVLVNILDGGWCPSCRGLPPGDIEQMRLLATERGGELLSIRYQNANIRLRWRCAAGHEWLAKPADVTKGSWCHTCAKAKGGRPRLTLQEMQHTAAERGGQCLSDVYVNNKQRLLWRCARGHEWLASGNRVRQGSWCPRCKYSVRGTLGGMEALALERGGRCLSRSWNDHRKPLRFRCVHGHVFELIGSAVRTGVWCPRCAAATSERVARAHGSRRSQ